MVFDGIIDTIVIAFTILVAVYGLLMLKDLHFEKRKKERKDLLET